MQTTNEKVASLKSLRESLNLSAQAVANSLAVILKEGSRTGASVINIEDRGTRDWYVIKALAAIYGVTPEEIASLASPKNLKQNV